MWSDYLCEVIIYVKWLFMWSNFILKWSEASYGEVLVDKGAMYITVNLYCGYLIILWLFHLGVSCTVFVVLCAVVVLLLCDVPVWVCVFCNVWVCVVCVCFVMCGRVWCVCFVMCVCVCVCGRERENRALYTDFVCVCVCVCVWVCVL